MIDKIGVDIIENERFVGFLDQPSRLEKILSPFEIAYVWSCSHFSRQLEYIASRFAAKEALIKAGCVFEFPSVSILHREDGSPYVDGLGDLKIHLSISHNQTTSIAFVVIEK